MVPWVWKRWFDSCRTVFRLIASFSSFHLCLPLTIFEYGTKIRSIYHHIFSWRCAVAAFDFWIKTTNWHSTLQFHYLGRLHQVEYAIEAINNAGTCVGLLSADGIVLTAERRVVSKLLAPSKTSEKTYTIDNHVVALVAGLTADANILINQSRLGSQRYCAPY